MSKPGVNFYHFNSKIDYCDCNYKLVSQVKDYCKSEGIHLPHYLYLLEGNKKKASCSKKFFLSLASVGTVALFTVLFNLI